MGLHRFVDPSVPSFLLCGAFAGVVAQTAIHPLDIIRRRRQVRQEGILERAAV